MISFNVYASCLWLGVIQALLYALLLVKRSWSHKRLSDALLAALLLQAAALIFPFMLGFMGIGIMWKELLFFPIDPGLLIGPSILAYLLSVTNQEFRLKQQHLLHLIPFSLYIVYHLSIFLQGSTTVQVWLSDVHIPYVEPIEDVLIMLSNLLYLYLSFRHYKQYRTWIETEFSNPEGIRLNWYRTYLFIVAFGISLSWIFTLIQLFGHHISYTQSWWEYAGIVLLIYTIAINGYHQTQHVYLYFEKEETDQSVKPNSAFGDEELKRYQQELVHLMTHKQLFLQPQLSLREVAHALGISKAQLSQVINQGFQKNFSQFVNDYRVENFKQAVQHPQNGHLSFLALALDSGFNSKATFNRVFKITTGMSPREYVMQTGKTLSHPSE